MKKKITEWEVLSPDGWSNFDFVKQTISNKLYNIKLENNIEIKCTGNHKLYDKNNKEILAQKININDILITKTGLFKVINIDIEETEKEKKVYDLINVEKNNNYYVNDIKTHNSAFVPINIMTEFLASVLPIVSSSKDSQIIQVSTPNGIGNFFYETYTKAELGIDVEGWKNFRIDWWNVPGRDEEWKKQQIATFNGDMVRFNQEFGNCENFNNIIEIIDDKGVKRKIKIGNLYNEL